MSRVAKKATKHFNLVAQLQAVKGPAAVTARRKLREMRDVYYTTDEYLPSAGAAWQPEGGNKARGSTGRAKKLQSGYDAKQRQGLNIGRP
uniref:Uncharacterized protein n=3 Tax=unclassified bacterial viruses TaxID=12333 RepID=A0AAU6W1L1_9VIRU